MLKLSKIHAKGNGTTVWKDEEAVIRSWSAFFIVLFCFSPIFFCVFLDTMLASAGRFNRCLYCMFGLLSNCSI